MQPFRHVKTQVIDRQEKGGPTNWNWNGESTIQGQQIGKERDGTSRGHRLEDEEGKGADGTLAFSSLLGLNAMAGGASDLETTSDVTASPLMADVAGSLLFLFSLGAPVGLNPEVS